MQIKPIPWMVSPMPCFKCHEQEAAYRITVRLSPASTLTACLCAECSQLGEMELVAHFMEEKNEILHDIIRWQGANRRA